MVTEPHQWYRAAVSTTVPVQPFEVAIGDDVLSDLRARLAHTRWPDEVPGTDWDDGTNMAALREIVSDWQSFDWRDRERRLNLLPQFTAEVGDTRVHFLHVRGRGPSPFPLLLTHGWPSTFCEYLKLIPLLTDPGANGGDPSDAFDVVVPSLPGYGFSDRPATPGMTNDAIADLWSRLMVEGLGYRSFGAQGSDIGAGVTARLGLRHPDRLVGIHLSATGMPRPPEPLTDAERDYFATVERWDADEGAYAHMHATRPQTLGYGLTDSPVGLAAWLVEKFRAWSDGDDTVYSRLGREWVLTTLTLYWATTTITSSTRVYYEYRRRGRPLSPGSRIPVPAGFALFPNERNPMPSPPRELAERYYNIHRWTEWPSGGHFPAVEEPQRLTDELRAFFRPLRDGRVGREIRLELAT